MENKGIGALGIILIILGIIIVLAVVAWVIVAVVWNDTSQDFNDAQDQARQRAEDFGAGNPNQFTLPLVKLNRLYNV